jgi:hypothetical protein
VKKFLCLVSCFVPVTLFAQTPFDGTWKTNMAQSKLSQKPVVYSLTNGMYECESCVPKIEVKADGQDQPVTGQTDDTIAVQVVDANTIHLTGKKAGKATFEATRTASQDGKMLTASRTDYPVDGSQPVKVEVKWTRVSKGPAGSNATSGSWRIESLNVDPAGLTSTWKSVGDGLSLSTPTGFGWEAKFDGKDCPVKGTYANETVSLKSLGDHSIEVTYKRDGKIENVDKVTVSPDGKKKTTIVDNKPTGRISTYTDEKQ